MVEDVSIMIAAVVVAIAFMMFFAAPVGAFVGRHPTIKMLALSFLLLIGLTLIVEAFDVHVPKGYIYFAMGFSVFVELLNIRLRRKSKPVQLHERYTPEPEKGSHG
jgi:predicted tellurium resistance membrane protein TerC